MPNKKNVMPENLSRENRQGLWFATTVRRARVCSFALRPMRCQAFGCSLHFTPDFLINLAPTDPQERDAPEFRPVQSG